MKIAGCLSHKIFMSFDQLQAPVVVCVDAVLFGRVCTHLEGEGARQKVLIAVGS